MLAPATAEHTWLEELEAVPSWRPATKPTVVLSPHPDDETLGAGGLIAIQREQDIDVTILAVTDGEAAYADSRDLADTRRIEQQFAVQALGVSGDSLVRFGLPDSHVMEYQGSLVSLIGKYIRRGTLLLAPWPFDPHPDHEACGLAAVRAAENAGATLVFYLFWAWHRNLPATLQHESLRRLHIPANARVSRASALACYRSQTEWANGSPILPDVFLAPARRPFETFIVND